MKLRMLLFLRYRLTFYSLFDFCLRNINFKKKIRPECRPDSISSHNACSQSFSRLLPVFGTEHKRYSSSPLACPVTRGFRSDPEKRPDIAVPALPYGFCVAISIASTSSVASLCTSASWKNNSGNSVRMAKPIVSYFSFSCPFPLLAAAFQKFREIVTNEHEQPHDCYIIQQEENQRFFKIKEYKLDSQEHIACNIPFCKGVNSVYRNHHS